MIMTEIDSLIDYLLANSGLAAALEPPVTLEDLLTPLCTETMPFNQLVKLLERLPQFENDKLVPSNTTIDGEPPYESLRGLNPYEIKTLYECIDFLCLSSQIRMKIHTLVIHEENYMAAIVSLEDYIVHGDLRGLQYFYDPTKTQGLCTHAATHGKLKCLEWLHLVGAKWDQYTCRACAKYDRLECLQFAIENGCPHNLRDIFFITKSNKIRAWLYSQFPDKINRWITKKRQAELKAVLVSI